MIVSRKATSLARAIQRKGAPISTFWAFIIGTIHAIARITRHQWTCYNGWKRQHFLKYHVMVMPASLVSHLFGPVNGRRNDSLLWRKSNLPVILQHFALAPDGTPLQVNGDPAYSITNFLLAAYQRAQVTEH
ncbi:hypothetical protein HOY82DRAFT_494242 [Tuber indicum]|nr:hypothetical protein HOY82DRAFT_494242 [Tuber indicum]